MNKSYSPDELPIADGAIHCKGCGILVWEKDTRKGLCIDCLIDFYENQDKQIGLFEEVR